MSTSSFSKSQVEVIDLQQQVARLQALLEVSRQVHAAVRPEEVLQSVLRIVVRELEMAGAHVTEPALTIGDMPPAPWDGCPRYALLSKDGTQLTELVVNPGPGKTLSLYEQDFLEGLVLQAGVAVENAHYHDRAVEWARVQQDLDAARAIQRSLLPQQMSEISGYSVAVRSSTCYEVGGDYLDIIPLTSGELMIVVADVAGKGLASALVGSSFRSALRAIANSGMSLVDIATHMNVLHYNEGEESRRRYVTAIFLRLDPNTHTLEVVNAGHNPGFLLNGSDLPEMIEASGTPVGMLPFSTYSAEKYVLSNKAKLLIYTDGMTEVFQGNEEFGQDRLLEAFRASRAVDAPSTLKSIWQALDAFSNQESQTDDMTALVIGRKP